MANPVPLKKAPAPSVRLELAAEDLVARTQKILEIKAKAMRENVHYGIIPGCRKPSLWKPGAEILCQGFRLAPEFVTTSTQDLNHSLKWEKWDYDKRAKVEGVTKGLLRVRHPVHPDSHSDRGGLGEGGQRVVQQL